MENDIVVHLDTDTIRELIDRAESENYMLVRAVDGRWVRIVPRESK